VQALNGPLFGAGEWDSCRSPDILRQVADATHQNVSARKWRLLACAVARAVLDYAGDYGDRLAVAIGEALADGRSPPRSVQFVKNPVAPAHDPGRVSPQDEIARRCIADTPETWPLYRTGGASDELVVDLYHDLFPNPFVPLAWNPDWFTSTVRELAAHIYEAHEFSALPILADALQDAGCDDERILAHCRASRPTPAGAGYSMRSWVNREWGHRNNRTRAFQRRRDGKAALHRVPGLRKPGADGGSRWHCG
jgi:hypothetical protein